MPALLTRMSMRPWRSRTLPISASIEDTSVTSSAAASARWPASQICATASAAFSPRAAATTCAPREASVAATLRPMPRDAPVTIATLPERSNMTRLKAKRFLQRGEIVWPREVRHDRFFVNLLYEPAQDRPRAHFNIVGDAFRGKPADHRFPPDRRRDLLHKRVNGGSGVAFWFAVDIGNHRYSRILRREAP